MLLRFKDEEGSLKPFLSLLACQWLQFSVTDFQEVEEVESMQKVGGKDKITTEPTPELCYLRYSYLVLEIEIFSN